MPYYSKRKRSGSTSYRKKGRYSRAKKAGPKYRRTMRKRNVRGFRNVTSSARWPGLTLPAKVMKKFEYEDTQNIDTTAANIGRYYVYRTNDIYDPNAILPAGDATVQNYGVFVNSSMYRQWKVFGCKIKVTYMNTGGSMAMIVPVLTTNAGRPYGSYSYTQVNALSATPQAAEPVFLGPLTSGQNIKTRTYYAAPWIALGMSRAQYSSDPNTVGAYATRPTNHSYFSYVVIGVGAQATITVKISMVLYAQLYDLGMGVDTLAPGTDPDPADESQFP